MSIEEERTERLLERLKDVEYYAQMCALNGIEVPDSKLAEYELLKKEINWRTEKSVARSSLRQWHLSASQSGTDRSREEEAL